MSTKYGGEAELVREINRLTKELAYVKQLRRGDDILIRNLAGAVGIKLTAPNKRAWVAMGTISSWSSGAVSQRGLSSVVGPRC